MYIEIENRTYKQDNTIPSEAEIFRNCCFSGIDLSEMIMIGKEFSEIEMNDCILSLNNLRAMRMHDIKFLNCKLEGLDFTVIDKLIVEVDFHNCLINECNFSALDLDKTSFSGCRITNTDFINTSLKEVSFCGCNLVGSVFHNTDLRGADFRKAVNYNIDPFTNKLKKAFFELPEAVNLLKYLEIQIS